MSSSLCFLAFSTAASTLNTSSGAAVGVNAHPPTKKRINIL